MVAQNVETDLDIMKGAMGKIVDIVLHEAESPIGEEPVVHLKHLPASILVKLNRTQATQPEGLEESVIPVEVSSKTFKIQALVGNKYQSCTVHRHQFLMTAIYRFTDYRSEGLSQQSLLKLHYC